MQRWSSGPAQQPTVELNPTGFLPATALAAYLQEGLCRGHGCKRHKGVALAAEHVHVANLAPLPAVGTQAVVVGVVGHAAQEHLGGHKRGALQSEAGRRRCECGAAERSWLWAVSGQPRRHWALPCAGYGTSDLAPCCVPALSGPRQLVHHARAHLPPGPSRPLCSSSAVAACRHAAYVSHHPCAPAPGVQHRWRQNYGGRPNALSGIHACTAGAQLITQRVASEAKPAKETGQLGPRWLA